MHYWWRQAAALPAVLSRSLAPGAVDTATFSGSYTIQQSDIDAQSVSNQATATGTTPDGDDVSDLSDDNSNLENDPTDTDLLKNGRISLIKIGVSTMRTMMEWRRLAKL
ncbi:DUF7507 domain-containing protein [Nonlabens agnitus]